MFAATTSSISTQSLKIILVDSWKADGYLSIDIVCNDELKNNYSYIKLQDLIFAKLGESYGIDLTPEQIPELKYCLTGKISDAAVSIKDIDKVPINLFLANPGATIVIKTLFDKEEMQKILEKITAINAVHQKVKKHADILEKMMAVSEFIHAAIDHVTYFEAWLEVDKGKQFFGAFTKLNANFYNLLNTNHAVDDYKNVIKDLPRNEDKLPWLPHNPISIPYCECEQLAKIADFFESYPVICDFLKQELLSDQSLLNRMAVLFVVYREKLESDKNNIQQQLESGREIDYDLSRKQMQVLVELSKNDVLFLDEIKKTPVMSSPPKTPTIVLLKKLFPKKESSAEKAVDLKFQPTNNKIDIIAKAKEWKENGVKYSVAESITTLRNLTSLKR